MFESLAERLQQTFRRLRNRGRLSEADVAEAVREVRMALLEADVHFRVVKDFVDRVRERAVGEELSNVLTPGQQVVKIVHEELLRLLGSDESDVRWAPAPPTVVMLCGLQGGGKTTTAGKLADFWKKQGHNPLLVATDIHRPAAIRQLEVVAESVGVPVFQLGGADAASIAKAALAHARSRQFDALIIDTAGRLHTDEEMMEEIRQVASAVHPHETLLVLDALTGQDAVNAATEFARAVPLDGIVLTKLDGDARGGAALSLRAVTQVPVKFAGVGERLDALEPFHPDRMANRILGMGDVLTLIERAQDAVDRERAIELQEKLLRQEFTLEDFLEQIDQMQRIGPLDQILSMLPKQMLGPLGKLTEEDLDPREFAYMRAIISSMTFEERRNPRVLNSSRKKRIARGSGTHVADINALLKQFDEAQRTMRQMMGAHPTKKKKVKPFQALRYR